MQDIINLLAQSPLTLRIIGTRLCYFFFALLVVFVGVNPARSQSKSEVVEVPFTFERSSVIVRATVNGQGPFNMLLDTGAEQSAVDVDTAKALSVKHTPIGNGKVVATGKKGTTIFLTRLKTIEVGAFTGKDVLAVATDFSRISRRVGIPIQGVLGYNFFSNHVLQFDYSRRVVRFYSASLLSKSDQANTPNRTILPFRFYSGDKFPVLDGVYVNGKRIKAELDTGHSGVLALTAAAVKKLGLEAEAQAGEEETSEGALSTSSNRTGKLRTLAVGGITIESPKVSFRSPNSGLDDAPFEGILGNDFFKNFVVTFDYRSMVVAFESPGPR